MPFEYLYHSLIVEELPDVRLIYVNFRPYKIYCMYKAVDAN